MPYIIDGDFKLTESKAIHLYIIKKSGKTDLLGKGLQDEARVESIIGVLADIRSPLLPLLFDAEWKSKLNDVIIKVTPKLDDISKFIGNK